MISIINQSSVASIKKKFAIWKTFARARDKWKAAGNTS
jgi:hypothetical protein